MHIYYRLMTRQNYQTTVGKRSLTHPHSKRVSAAPVCNQKIVKVLYFVHQPILGANKSVCIFRFKPPFKHHVPPPPSFSQLFFSQSTQNKMYSSQSKTVAKVQPHTTTHNPTASWQTFSGHSTSVRKESEVLMGFDEIDDTGFSQHPNYHHEGMLWSRRASFSCPLKSFTCLLTSNRPLLNLGTSQRFYDWRAGYCWDEVNISRGSGGIYPPSPEHFDNYRPKCAFPVFPTLILRFKITMCILADSDGQSMVGADLLQKRCSLARSLAFSGYRLCLWAFGGPQFENGQLTQYITAH